MAEPRGERLDPPDHVLISGFATLAVVGGGWLAWGPQGAGLALQGVGIFWLVYLAVQQIARWLDL